jgi:tetratricopeptide (TPR) repeat protein
MTARYLALVAGLTLGAQVALGQSSASEHIALGDQAHAALKPAEAVQHYEAALALDPKNFEALWKASRDLVDLAEFEPKADQRTAWYKTARDYAERAVGENPTDAEAHFTLARALGRVALTLGVKDRIKYAGLVREHALKALAIDSLHPGALHVMGRWNAEVMRLSGFSRFMAKNFLGGKVFNEASWANARRYMEKSVEVDPERLTHHLDLAEIYADMGEKAKARERFDFVLRGRATEFNDAHYKQQAEERLAKLK